MRYILSREGQQDVQNFGVFYPLPQSVIDEQLKKVN
jgi:phosphate transport system substrate-binding protein